MSEYHNRKLFSFSSSETYDVAVDSLVNRHANIKDLEVLSDQFYE